MLRIRFDKFCYLLRYWIENSNFWYKNVFLKIPKAGINSIADSRYLALGSWFKLKSNYFLLNLRVLGGDKFCPKDTGKPGFHLTVHFWKPCGNSVWAFIIAKYYVYCFAAWRTLAPLLKVTPASTAVWLTECFLSYMLPPYHATTLSQNHYPFWKRSSIPRYLHAMNNFSQMCTN